ncbi:MAG: phosphoribosylformylglycinamidine cyclo-ligase [Nitrospiraceae bacterium]|nr:phosphoribosylformylglycinamidine cyclo-ligase [Nitrospiraceae bacterium]
MGLTYKKAGVDIREGEKLVELIAPMAGRTKRREVLKGIGLFGALFELDAKRYKRPVLVSGTDGVGTKLKIAFMTGRHDTVGIDLVAMCVNDILTCGAEPLFFLDYFATGKLAARKAAMVIGGIARGCEEAGCALVGGETAEMPEFYGEGEYDLAGFAVGVVEKEAIIDGSSIRPGDALVGLASSGLHSNGYSLARKALLEAARYSLASRPRVLAGRSLGAELLEPTRIYVKAFQALRKNRVTVKGMAHITGGGIPGNLNRILPRRIDALVDEGAWTAPPIFGLIREAGGISKEEMKKAFNMGIGFVAVTPAEEAKKAVSVLRKAGYESSVIGSAVKGAGRVKYE